MGDGSLSQDEIDALLMESDDSAPQQSKPEMNTMQSASSLMREQAVMRDLLTGIVRDGALPSLSVFFGGRNISLSGVNAEPRNSGQLLAEFQGPQVQATVDFHGAVSGHNLVVFSRNDAGIISSLMMGNASSGNADLTEAHLSTIQEFVNQLFSMICSQFSVRLGGAVNPSPAVVTSASSSSDLMMSMGNLLKVTYDLNIDGSAAVKMYHIIDASIASAVTAAVDRVSQPQQPVNFGGSSPYQQDAGGYHPQSDISSVKYPQFSDQTIAPVMTNEMSLLMDVPMTLTVELGRTSKLVKEILGLGEGSIVELDKLAGEPVDLLVNGKLFAKGEVVVIDENFGVRVTDIVSPDERFIQAKQQ